MVTFDAFSAWYKTLYSSTSSALTNAAMITSDLLGVMLSFATGFFLVNLYDAGLINFRSFVSYWPYLLVFILFFISSALYPGVSLAPSDELKKFFTSSLLAHLCIILSRYV